MKSQFAISNKCKVVEKNNKHPILYLVYKKLSQKNVTSTKGLEMKSPFK